MVLSQTYYRGRACRGARRPAQRAQSYLELTTDLHNVSQCPEKAPTGGLLLLVANPPLNYGLCGQVSLCMLVSTFNQEKALLGTVPIHCKIYESSLTALVTIPPLGNPPVPGGDMLPKHSHEPATSLSGVSGNNGQIQAGHKQIVTNKYVRFRCFQNLEEVSLFCFHLIKLEFLHQTISQLTKHFQINLI